MKLKHNILVVSSEFPPQPGGIGNHAYNLALHLSNSGYDVEVIADKRSKTGIEERNFDSSLPFKVFRINRYDQRILMYPKRISQTFKRLKGAHCVIATGKFSLWNVAFLGSFFKVKKLAVIHGSEVNFKSFLLKKSVDFSLKRMNHIIAVSNYTKSLIAHLGVDVTVIPNGIDMTNWQHVAKRDMTMVGRPILTTVGRVSSRKGQLNVIKHLPNLIEKFPEIHYHCVGIPTEAKGFIEVAKKLGVVEHITFHGSVSNEKLKQFLSETDIFIMLSSESETGDVEGFGIAILEANAFGVPAIGSKGCGIEDAINNYKSGILINSDDVLAFKSAIDTICNNMETYKSASKLWANQHSWNEIINKYISLIDNK